MHSVLTPEERARIEAEAMHEWQAELTKVGILDRARLAILMFPRKVAIVDGVWRVALHDVAAVIKVHEHTPTRSTLARLGEVMLGALVPGDSYTEFHCGFPDAPSSLPDGHHYAVKRETSGREIGLNEVMVDEGKADGLRLVRSLLASMEANHA